MFFKDRLAAGGDPLRGVLAVIPSAVATQAIAAGGADFVLIDREHGPIDRESMHAMIAATAGTSCAPLVRVPTADAEADVAAALDAGVEGIVYPMLRTAADAERCVAQMTYPPAGSRGWGPFAAHARHGTNIAAYAGDVAPHLTCAILIETPEAVENIDAIARTPGIDVIVVARFDLSTALGVPGQFDAPVLTDAVSTVENAADSAGVPLGGIALTADQATPLVAGGYRFLINGVDTLMLEGQTAAFEAWQ
jgi:4-hydroxy-2-oxoheptanedioate aldolase